MSAPRRILTDDEKKQLLGKWKKCYICETPFEGYSDSEIQFDHIYDYASGYSQDLSNFAPVHASKDPSKRNCHKDKGRKSPFEYKEELRIRKALDSIHGLKDLCPTAKTSTFNIDYSKRVVELNGESYNLFSQRIGSEDHWYFFAELPTDYVESDEIIQLRPLDSRIIALTFSLRKSLQLLPSLARLDTQNKKIKVFDGQHKAVAQIVGNNRKRIPCIVFVDPEVNWLRQTVTEAHSTFVQQRYAPSHIDRKLADIYGSRIKEFQHGDPNLAYSEIDILKHESKAEKRKFLRATITEGLRDSGDFVTKYVSELAGARGREKPIPYKDLEVFVDTFANLEPVDRPSGDPENYREPELKNLYLILSYLEKYSLKDKWDPQNLSSATAQLPNLCYLTHPFKIWIESYKEAIKHAIENIENRAIRTPICYGREFKPEIQNRIDKITERLFTHGLWLNPANVPILRSIYDEEIRKLFEKEELDYIHLTKLD
jgi:hypothetical protein